MCKRSAKDPLVLKFLEDYGVNLLRLPRTRAGCGDLYVKNGKTVSAPGDLRALLDAPVELPAVNGPEQLADLAGAISRNVSFGVGLGILEAFLAALGAPGLIDKLKAKLERTRDGGISFSFRSVTRESVDPIALGDVFAGRRFKEGHPLVGADSRFYVVGGVVRSPSISIALTDRRSHGIDVRAEVAHAVSADANVEVKQDDTGKITYQGDKQLAIGVELYELRYDATAARFEMRPAGGPLPLRGRPVSPVPAFPAEDDEALLELDG
jgi:hypothetical protein